MFCTADLENLNISATQVTSKDLTKFFSLGQFDGKRRMAGARQVLVYADDVGGEFMTPGADMSEVLQAFVNKNSERFKGILIDENAISNDPQLTDYQIVHQK